MRFRSPAYASFRERVAHVIALHFDGPYAGDLSADIDNASWVSVAEAARLLKVCSARIRAGINAGALTARTYTSGFGHRHSLVRRDDIEAIAKARRRFIDRRAAAKLLHETGEFQEMAPHRLAVQERSTNHIAGICEVRQPGAGRASPLLRQGCDGDLYRLKG
jgi:hypothetical protein